MREVFGERGAPTISAARAIKPTEVGDAAKRPNHDKTLVNKGRLNITPCPHRGDRGGDRVKTHSQRALSLKKGSSRTIETHHSTSCIRRIKARGMLEFGERFRKAGRTVCPQHCN